MFLIWFLRSENLLGVEIDKKSISLFMKLSKTKLLMNKFKIFIFLEKSHAFDKSVSLFMKLSKTKLLMNDFFHLTL